MNLDPAKGRWVPVLGGEGHDPGLLCKDRLEVLPIEGVGTAGLCHGCQGLFHWELYPVLPIPQRPLTQQEKAIVRKWQGLIHPNAPKEGNRKERRKRRAQEGR